MFSDNLGFNPFANDNNGHTNGHASERHRFLSSFKQQHIYCYNGNPRKKISSMNHTYDLQEALTANVNNSADVYFYVNVGRKLYAINQFACCFCDMDAGRDNEGKYFKPSVVMQHKKRFLEKINNFPVKPSWVVDTRNGYQCYWLFDDASRKIVGNNKTFWNGLQKKLVNYFGGDPRAIKANQIYRVPYTWWRKGWEKKAPYFTSLLPGSTGQPINVADLKSALTGQPATLNIIPEKCSDEWYKGYAKAYKQSDANGVPVSANVASQYGWYQIAGTCVAKTGTVVSGSLPYLTATAGTLDDAVVAGDKIDNAKFITANGTPSAGFALVQANRPSANGNG